MTEQQSGKETRLWTPQGFREDDWTYAENAEALADAGRFILPLQVFLELDPQTRALFRDRLGVVLQAGDRLDDLAERLDMLSLVALVFPAFTDGRSYSKAELLRGRLAYGGAMRAVGQVLVDQLPHMLRVGFTEFEISNPVLLKRLEVGDIGGLPVYYQPSAKLASVSGKYAWRRTPAG
ncbi:DUF934 domain-containing protein [Mesorhizobium sp. A623]